MVENRSGLTIDKCALSLVGRTMQLFGKYPNVQLVQSVALAERRRVN